MVRPTMHSVRDHIDANGIGKEGLANDQRYKRRILERYAQATCNLAIASVLDRQRKQQERHKAAGRSRKPTRGKRHAGDRPIRRDFRSPEGFNECFVNTGRSYASRAAERMEKKQEGFPDVMRHPTTIGMAIIPFDGRVDEHLGKCRPVLRRTFKNLSHGFQVIGGFHIAVEAAADLSMIFPSSEWPREMDPVNHPDELFAYLHWHGIIADPYLSKQSIRKVIADKFPGKRRVCVAKVQPERTNKYGEITHGAQGYLEYAMMEKTEIKVTGPHRKKAAIIGLAKLSATWSKRNRSFSMGKSLATTGVKIDSERVMQLEIEERLQHVKRNWDKLDFAQQFIHLWMSGKVFVLNRQQPWLKRNTSIRKQFLEFFSLVRKWSTENTYEDLDFFDYLDVLRE